MAKRSWQKLKYLENEKSFYDEINIFHHFWRAYNEINSTIFLKGENPTLNPTYMKDIFLSVLFQIRDQ